MKITKSKVFVISIMAFVLLASSLYLSDIKLVRGATLGLDSNASSHAIGAIDSGSSTTLTISTTNAGDIIYVAEYIFNHSPTLSVSSPHLSWISRGSYTYDTSNDYGKMQCWYAVASGTLASEVITFSSNAASGGMVVMAFAVSGADTTTPFDPNLSSPVYGHGYNSNPGMAATVQITTTNANDMIIGLNAKQLAAGTLDVGTGYTLINNIGQGSGSTAKAGVDEYQLVTSTKTNFDVSWSSTTVGRWITFADAFRAAAAVESITFAAPSGMTSDATGTVLTIDTQAYAYSALPHTFSWVAGSTHAVTASSPVSAGDSKQYVFASWSNGNGLAGVGPGTFTTPTATTTVTATYTTQYKVTFDASANVKSDSTATIVTVAGAAKTSSNLPFTTGWITSGGTVTWSYSSPVASTTSPSGTRYSWASTSGLSQTAQSGTLTVTAFGTVTATYNTQYALSVTSSYGTPSPAAGTNWIAAGSTTASVTSPFTSGVVSYTCTGWTGTGSVSSGSAATTTFTINQPSSITWTWTPSTLSIPFRTSGMTTDVGSATVLTIDGTPYSYSALQTLSLNLVSGSTHSVTAASPVSGGTGKQYVFSSWTNGNGLSGVGPSIFTVPATTPTVTVNYQAQYYLTVTSAYGAPTGQNWYNSGASASFSVPSPVSGSSETQYSFSSWTGTGTGSYSGTTNSRSVTMNNAMTEVALWTTQYQLTVTSAYDTPSPAVGISWQNAGSVTASVTSPANSGVSTYSCTGWIGTGSVPSSGTTTSTVFTISGPSSITWMWQAIVPVTLQANGLSGDTAGTVLTIDGVPYTYSQLTSQLSLDSSAVGTGQGAASLTLTTNSPNELIYLSIVERGGTTISGVTSTGLSWHHRATIESSTSVTVETWYATCPTNGQTAIAITANPNTYYISAVAFGIKGANTADPFDGSAVTNTGFSNSASTSVTTHNTNDFVIAAVAINTAPSITATTGSNFNLINTEPASSSRETSAEYRIVSNTGTYASGFTLGSTQYWAIIEDAIKANTGSSITFNWLAGSTHTISAATPVSAGTGKQYSFGSWSDPSDFSGTIFTVPSSITTSIATFNPQYQLVVTSAHGTPTGDGWYASGGTANFGVTSPDGTIGTRYVTSGYTGDASGSGSSGSVTMNSAKTVTFGWNTQYQVSFAVNPTATGSTTPSTSNWYGAGSTANSVSASSNSGYDFKSWSTSNSITFADSTQGSTTMTVNGPGTATANFQEQIQVLSTSLTISCTPASVNPSGQTILTGKLTLSSNHNTGVEGKTITLAYFDSANKWETIGTATTGSDGTYTEHWTIPSDLEKGFHIVQATFAADTTGNPQYLGQTAATGSDGEGIFVLPEYLFGTIAALGACFAALIIFKKRGSLPSFNRR